MPKTGHGEMALDTHVLIAMFASEAWNDRVVVDGLKDLAKRDREMKWEGEEFRTMLAGFRRGAIVRWAECGLAGSTFLPCSSAPVIG